ncbi:methylthioribulose 1-phosphate dehydratase [Bacillus thermocopriae]|uniref:Methylthioribulose-1-phosphate dehydratase n=2 Tax=Neobacillus thermocopriae TaxID=1215031 RepID=A0A6B3TTI8_9BACI|nr:methylthioribulose 1-phosphate dehydratase [Neobacillus thermocopriae]MED3623187.1 methylthioribulose 1-phosphate dehydratase [Neobacillus thermocopriae]MED3715082.1 methylthioribulose 1-phosphate dehydratase [Neobacillus thermocopriae]NEX79768.1 methylthioribulose 1-phosphate dehydratase [Neobacillus thermocopriae]
MIMLEERWRELADVKDELSERDWFMGTSGNLAIKVSDKPLQFLVTASGKDKRKRTNEDFLLVDEFGHPVEETHLKPSAETLLHLEIYQKTNAGCSLHVHTIDNNVISEIYGDRGEITFKGQELIKAFNKWEEDDILKIPIIHNFAHIPTLARAFSEHVKEDTGAVLIRNHGITVWGRNAFEAKKILEASEFLFRYQLRLLEYKPYQLFKVV